MMGFGPLRQQNILLRFCSRMTPSDHLETRPTRSSMAGGLSSAGERMRRALNRSRNTNDHGRPSQPSQRTNQPPSSRADNQTRATLQQQNNGVLPGSQTNGTDPDRLSPQRVSGASNPSFNNDCNRQESFILDDLVIDVFLAHPGAWVDDTPIYRVVAWDPHTFIYRLELHRDPKGRALMWIFRSWAEVRLVDEEGRWEELG
jgi:hypothetical protein